MATASSTVQTKRRTTGAAGPPSSLLAGETFHNETESVLYIGIGNNGSGVATSIISFAGVGAFVDKASAQTIAGVKTITSLKTTTQATSDNSTNAATTAFVLAAIAAFGGLLPTSLPSSAGVLWNDGGVVSVS